MATKTAATRTRPSARKAAPKAPEAGAGEVESVYWRGLEVRKLFHPWPFPLSVLPGGKLVANQVQPPDKPAKKAVSRVAPK